MSTSKPPGQPPVAASSPAPAANGTAPAGASKPLSNAELKKLQKAEKAARRAAAKGTEAGPPTSAPSGAPPIISSQPPSQSPALNRIPSDASRSEKPISSPRISSTLPASSPGLQVPGRKLSGRRQSVSGRNVTVSSPAVETPSLAAPSKNVAFFSHLYEQPRRRSLKGAPKNIHSQVVSLGIQMSNYVVCGSSSRCLAMLLAFKEVIRSYTTPVGTSLARHLVSHHLSPHIEYLKSCRPLSVSMGNAIRILKDHIVKIDPSVPESDAKEELLQVIDTIANERIVLADSLIRISALSHIVPGDVIVVFAKSSIVLDVLLHAHEKGISFSVIVIDTRPMFEGRHSFETLRAAGIPTTYALINSASYLIDRATKVFLGAHAIMGNGNLFSRVGTSIVSMLAHRRNIPVTVCCEAIKFTERVALDSIVMNEVAPADELFMEPSTISSGQGYFDETKKWEKADKLIDQWSNTPGLQALNLMYDVTPAQFISMIVTEYGVLPPSAVPAVMRNMTGA